MLWAKLRRAKSAVPDRGGLVSDNLEPSRAMKLAVFMLHVVHSTLNLVDEHWSVYIHTACVCPVQHVKCLMQQATVVAV